MRRDWLNHRADVLKHNLGEWFTFSYCLFSTHIKLTKRTTPTPTPPLHIAFFPPLICLLIYQLIYQVGPNQTLRLKGKLWNMISSRGLIAAITFH